ncbi:hypothetical protein EJ02DRAFT_494021 [Clathrospora elynae]|uniref:Uncharacterized protein n=1 Tax=Clathrospora elynae TaxID=706981 RepID=A0A6A5SJN1_9PLEO|nr:hypothetical protein EJ02DRAFT_494021 [Clathrospora elynae]
MCACVVALKIRKHSPFAHSNDIFDRSLLPTIISLHSFIAYHHHHHHRTFTAVIYPPRWDPYLDHPIVITDKFLLNGKGCVRFRGCTNFGGRRIEEKKADRLDQMDYYALALNDENIESHGRTSLLKMAPDSSTFAKRTYVNLSPNAEMQIELAQLQIWSGRKPLKFSQSSIQNIINCNFYQEAILDNARPPLVAPDGPWYLLSPQT